MEEIREDEKAPGRSPWPVFWTILVLLLSFVGYLIFADDGPPDDAWILPKMGPAPAATNPLGQFCKFIEAHRLDSLGYSKLSRGAKDFAKISTDDMRAFVERHGVQREAFDSLLQTDISTWNWPGLDEHVNLSTDLLFLSGCQETASQLQRMRVELLVREGRKEEAIAEALKTTRFGLGMSTGEGLLISWLVGLTCQRSGETSLRSALSMPWVDAGLLREAQEALIPLDPEFGQFHQTMSWEYLALKNTLLAGRSGPAKATLMARPGLSARSNLFLRPNRTLSNYLDLMRPVHEAATKDWPVLITAFTEQRRKVDEWRSHWFSFTINPNSTGNELLGDLGVSLYTICARGATTCALHRQAVIMIALRRHEFDEGKLPEKLETLVPKYLSSIPNDPFSNGPMHWDAASGRLHAIGPDLVDNFGSFQDPGKSMDKDVGMIYWWRTPVPAP